MFGTPVASIICTEAQARGSLHGHGLFWGGIPPHVLDDIAHTPELVQIAAQALDDHVQASLPVEVHDDWLARQLDHSPLQGC